MSREELPDWAPVHVRELPVYQPGKPAAELEREFGITGAIKVASNENPLGPSPRALDAAARAIAEVNRYPDGGGFYLKQALAKRLQVDTRQLVLGAGCNEIIHMLVAGFCQPGDEVLSHEYAFISYRIAALSRGVAFVAAPVDDNLACNTDALIERLSPRTRVVFVANPNNPTGLHVEPRALASLMEAMPETAVLVIDEAYLEYAQACSTYQSSIEAARVGHRVVVLRTFSKAYGLAGLRVGYGVMAPGLAGILERVRRPFNANAVAQAAALAALDDDAHVSRTVEAARAGTKELVETATASGFVAYPSLTNFVLVDVGRPASDAYEAMLNRGVIVRPMAGWGLPTCIRISVGTRSEQARTLEALSGLGSRIVRVFARLWLSVICVACGWAQRGAPPPSTPTVERSPTGAEKLLSLVPAGAEAVFEIEVQRLRNNEVVGELVGQLAGNPANALPGTDALAYADRLVICSYGIGSNVEQLVLVEGVPATVTLGESVAPGIVALGPPGLLRRVRAVVDAGETSLAEDPEFLRMRAAAMPTKATGAAFRATARLNFDARVALARALELDAVPTSFSVWGDVADDMALVALLAAEDREAAKRLARAAGRFRDRIAVHPTARAWGLGRWVAAADVTAEGRAARVVWVLGPKRLSRLVSRLLHRMEASVADPS